MKIKMKGIFKALLCSTVLFSLSLLNVHAQTVTSNQTGTHGGYNFEYWKDNGNGTMVLKDGGSFSCEWSNINNILFRKGLKYNETQTHQQIGNITMSYACNYSPNGNSYLSVYGWTVSPLVEYYIIEAWGNWRPPGNVSPKGTVTVDGGTYDIYETTRVNQPSIKGNTTFQQYWSVRQQKRTSGKISVSEHFKAWESKGMKMGKMYEVSLVVEGYQSSGKADVTEMSIKVGPDGSVSTPTPTNRPTATPTSKPPATPTPNQGSTGSLGDVNNDRSIDSTDYALVKRHILNISRLSGTGFSNADVNSDGAVDSTDYALIKKYLLTGAKFPGTGSTVPTVRPSTQPTPTPYVPTEIKVPSFSELKDNAKLPDPFKFINGTRMTSKDQWAQRRAEISALAQTFEYGIKPPKPQTVTGSMSGSKINVTCSENGKTISFACSIQYPSTGSAPYPAMIGIGMNTLNTSEILKLGVALITFPCDELGQQQGGGSRGKGKFYDMYGSNHSAGALMAWSWGVSRLIDALETTPAAKIDPTRLGVTGGSRYGKGALAAGAFDERMALTIPQESGNGGASGWRTADDEKKYKNVQTLGQIIGENPWFGKALDQFSGRTNKLPHDHHMVLSLCAPRGLLVIEAPDMEWLGAQSCYDTVNGARLIYEGLGIKDRFGFSSVGGHQHCQLPASQQPEITAFIKRFLLGDNSANTNVFKTDRTFNFDKAKWVDWSNTLN